MTSINEDDTESAFPIQQYVIKPSPKKHDSFSADDSHLSEPSSERTPWAASLDTPLDSGPINSTPKKLGILRLPATPGTGQSVRFGMREYDDGDESKMSNSTTNSNSLGVSPLKIKQDVSEDSIEMSLGFIRSPSNHTLADFDDDDEDNNEEIQDTSRQTYQTAPPSPPSHYSTGPIVAEIIRETEELDQLHSERSDVLLNRVKQAEDDLEMTRRLLHLEKEKNLHLIGEAESAQAGLQKMREEAKRVEMQQKTRLQELEVLISTLHDQLDKKKDTSMMSDGEKEEADVHELEEKVTLLARKLEEECNEKEQARKSREGLESRVRDLAEEQKQCEEEKERLQKELDEVKRIFDEQKKQSEAADLSLQKKREEEKAQRANEAETDEEEFESLRRQLVEMQDEQKALQDALVSAQKQIGALQGLDYKEKEALACTTDELAAMKRQLLDVQDALAASQQEVQAVKSAKEEFSQKYFELEETMNREKTHWQKKHEQMENENDNLLQSLVEAEEHRRATEDDLSNKRDSTLQESRRREEEAINLAQEMQSKLERVESKLDVMTTRTAMLEHEVGDRGIQLVKLEKAKERLEEDNLNYSIALSSKQQELSLLKRNTSRSLRNTPIATANGKTNSSQRLDILASRPSLSSARKPLGEIQAGDESGSSLAPLQSGPLSVKTMRRRTMDVDTPSARPLTARFAGTGARTTRVSLAFSSTPKASLLRSERPKIPTQEPTSNGPPSRSSSQASQRSSLNTRSSLTQSSRTPSRQSSSSSATVQIKSNLSSSILASEGPMDISELQTDQEATNKRQQLLDQSRDLQRARVPIASAAILA